MSDRQSAKEHSKDWFDYVTTGLQVLAMVGGVIAFAVGYYAKNEADREQAMFTFMQRYYEGPVADARKKVEAIWLDDSNNAQLDAAKNDKNKTIVAIVKKSGAVEDLSTLVDFFESLATCVNIGVCDHDIACAMFKSDAAGIDDTYAAIFEDQKRVWGRYPNEKTKIFVASCQ